MTAKVPTCKICKGEIHPDPISGWTQGHNAWPLHEGRCCDSCNNLVVAERIAKSAQIFAEVGVVTLKEGA